MPFIDELLNYRSLSIVGLEKNTGKTECLNYVLSRLPLENIRVGVSSIGIDGEQVDQVTQSSKPEILLREGIVFTTSEKHYKERRIVSEILHIDEEETSLGRLVTAIAVTKGKVLLSGPSTTASLKRWIGIQQSRFATNLTIVDGALSRLSPASPAVSESMILATGAALSLTYNELINKTSYIAELIDLPITKNRHTNTLNEIDKGIWRLHENGDTELLFESAFMMSSSCSGIYKGESMAVFISGALTDRVVNMFSRNVDIKIEIIVRDFTKIFVNQQVYRNFIKTGGKLTVLQKSKLISICVNPVSPTGYTLDSDRICEELQIKTGIKVYDILKYGS